MLGKTRQQVSKQVARILVSVALRNMLHSFDNAAK